jgi:hypothetical protein
MSLEHRNRTVSRTPPSTCWWWAATLAAFGCGASDSEWADAKLRLAVHVTDARDELAMHYEHTLGAASIEEMIDEYSRHERDFGDILDEMDGNAAVLDVACRMATQDDGIDGILITLRRASAGHGEDLEAASGLDDAKNTCHEHLGAMSYMLDVASDMVEGLDCP